MSVLHFPSPQPLPGAELRSYSDPVIFTEDRVLGTLLRKETRYISVTVDYFQRVQDEITPDMRQAVSEWMLEVCTSNRCQPEVFCLAVNYLDRFMGVCRIRKSQLQLVGAVCLLVSWKVREHTPLPPQKLVSSSDFSISLREIMEWEVLLLTKLDWDMCAVVALDFLEHFFQRLSVYKVARDERELKASVRVLVALCSTFYSFSFLPASQLAASAILTVLRPALTARFDASPCHLQSQEDRDVASAEGLSVVLSRLANVHEDVLAECSRQMEAVMMLAETRSPRKRQRGGSFGTPTKVLNASLEFNF